MLIGRRQRLFYQRDLDSLLLLTTAGLKERGNAQPQRLPQHQKHPVDLLLLLGGEVEEPVRAELVADLHTRSMWGTNLCRSQSTRRSEAC